MAEYIQCLICGRMTPTNRGICYHCGSPLPTEIRLPRGTIICPNCLKITPVNTGYCTHCKSPLPPDLVDAALASSRSYVELRPHLFGFLAARHSPGSAIAIRGRGYPYLATPSSGQPENTLSPGREPLQHLPLRQKRTPTVWSVRTLRG